MRNDIENKFNTRRSVLKGAVSLAVAAGLPRSARAATGDSSADVIFIKPDDASYTRFRQPFNNRIVSQPAVIAACANASGVQAAIQYAKSSGMPVAIKSGGHCFEGYCLNQGGLVIDLSQMNQLQLDERQNLSASPGCKLSSLYDYLLPKGRLVPTGSCGNVGVAGLTLGGGYGMFTRKYGMTCDSLVRVQMVDGTGTLRDSRDHPELLWACRGGGNGNFGVITKLEFATRAAPDRFHSHRFVFHNLSPKKVSALAAHWFEATSSLPPEAFSAWVLNRNTLTILITTFSAMQDTDFQEILAGFALDADKTFPEHSDATGNSVRRYYGQRKPLNFKNISAGFYHGFDDFKPIAEEVFKRVAESPGMCFQINTFGQLVTDKQLAMSSAFPHRSFAYIGELQCYWDSPAQERQSINTVEGIRQLFRDCGIHAHYVNYPDINFENWETAYYGTDNYRRLQAIKLTYDPDNIIQHPQSVRLPNSA